MSQDGDRPTHITNLRQQAQQKAASLELLEVSSLSPEEVSDMIHDLRVHQIELEMQNEELIRSHAELDAVRNRYFDLYDLAPVGYCTVTEQGMVTEANLTLSALLGINRGALITQPLSRFIHKDDQDTYYLHRKDLFASGTRQTCELRLLTSGGSYFWATLEAVVEIKPDGESVCRIVLSDIAARKKTEEQLIQTAAALRSAQRVSHTGSWTWHVKENRLKWSDEMYRIFGYERENFSGNLNEVVERSIHPEDRAAVNQSNQAVINDAKLTPLEYRIIWPDGSVHCVWAEAGEIVLDSAGKPAVLSGIVQDITALKDAEREKQKLQDLLFQSQKMESVGLLAGGVAHDLNNMLTPILGHCELLLEELSAGDEKRHPLEQIMRAGERARDVVRQLLAFSRKQVLEFKPVDLNRVLRDFIGLLRRTIRENVMIKFSPGETLPPLMGDVVQLEQVIVNLVVNAQDAMPGGGTLFIGTGMAELDQSYADLHQGVAPGDYVTLTVSDTGEGMDAETLSQIFDPFFTTKELGRGTGLGLSTAYGIVKQHGGSISVYSEPAFGTTFKVYLPKTDSATVREISAKPVPAEALCGTETVLLVEDNDMARDLIESMLRRKGYRVITAGTGTMALDLLTIHRPQLLLTDVIMPEMDGKALYSHASKLHPGIKVVYMSGYPESVITQEDMLENAFNFIQKPFTIQTMAGKLREVLDGNHL